MRKALAGGRFKKILLNIYPNLINCFSCFSKTSILESVCGVSRGSSYEFAEGLPHSACKEEGKGKCKVLKVFKIYFRDEGR